MYAKFGKSQFSESEKIELTWLSNLFRLVSQGRLEWLLQVLFSGVHIQ